MAKKWFRQNIHTDIPISSHSGGGSSTIAGLTRAAGWGNRSFQENETLCWRDAARTARRRMQVRESIVPKIGSRHFQGGENRTRLQAEAVCWAGPGV